MGFLHWLLDYCSKSFLHQFNYNIMVNSTVVVAQEESTQKYLSKLIYTTKTHRLGDQEWRFKLRQGLILLLSVQQFIRKRKYELLLLLEVIQSHFKKVNNKDNQEKQKLICFK